MCRCAGTRVSLLRSLQPDGQGRALARRDQRPASPHIAHCRLSPKLACHPASEDDVDGITAGAPRELQTLCDRQVRAALRMNGSCCSPSAIGADD